MKGLQSLVAQTVKKLTGTGSPKVSSVKLPKVALPKIVRHMIRSQKMWSLQTVNHKLAQQCLLKGVTAENFNALRVIHIAAGTHDLRALLSDPRDEKVCDIDIYISGPRDWPKVEIEIYLSR
jgi:hypothetical protein